MLFNAGQNAALAHSRSKYEQHKFCPRCGSDKVKTVRGRGFVPTAAQYVQGAAAPVVNVNVNVSTGDGTASSVPVVDAVPNGTPSLPIPPTFPPYRPPSAFPPVPPPPPSTPRWKSARFWFFALPFATGGLASWVPPLWVASKVHEGQIKARLYVIAATTAVLALIGGVLVGSAPEDAMGSASGPRADIGAVILLVAISIGTWTAVLYRQRVFLNAPAPAGARPVGAPSLPGVQEAQARRQRRAQYRSLSSDDIELAREMHLGRPDRTPAFDDGGLVDLNALNAAELERHAHVTAAEAASIVSTRDTLGRLSSVDELVVHGDLTTATAERLRDYAVFIG
jgi:hypothetical protein